MGAPNGEPQDGSGSGQNPPQDPPQGQQQQGQQDPPQGGQQGQQRQTGTLTQDQVDAIVRDRIARERAKFADYDTLKAKAANADRLQQERETETEKAIREAKEQAAAEANAAVRPRLVAAEFRAAAAGRIDAARLGTLTEDIDFSRYLTDAGEVDLEKVAKKIDAWAPKTPEGDQQGNQEQGTRQPGPRPDRTQGQHGAGKPSGISAGANMFAATRKRGGK